MDSINNASKFGGDAWLELQAFKTRQINRREKLNRHKDLINGFSTHHQTAIPTASTSSQCINSSDINNTCQNRTSQPALVDNSFPLQSNHRKQLNLSNNAISSQVEAQTQSSYQSGYSDNVINQRTNLIDQSPPTISDICQTGIPTIESPRGIVDLECLLLLKLCDVALKLPIDSNSLQRSICKIRGFENTSQPLVENLLQKFAHQELITIEEPSATILTRRNKQHCVDEANDETCIYVISADHTKLVEFDKSFASSDSIRSLLIESRNDDLNADELDFGNCLKSSVPVQNVRTWSRSNVTNSSQGPDSSLRSISETSRTCSKQNDNSEQFKSPGGSIKTSDPKKRQASDDVESLLSLSSTRERESKKLGEELLELLSKPTAKERSLLERFRSADGYQVQEFCPKGTKDECRRNNKGSEACEKLHFKKIIAKHTEESLGDCSFLNTCFHMDSCKYVHYEVDYDSNQQRKNQSKRAQPNDSSKSHRKLDLSNPVTKQGIGKQTSKDESINKALNLVNSSPQTTVDNYSLKTEEQRRIDLRNRKRFKTVLYPPQWIQCDLRYFDMSLLGKFSVVMADPPWDIHMELPYGTMSDDEMRKLNVPALQDEGVIFLWVTGRAMELGRECLALWGYERCDEIIWVKTNQLQRIIRTGRTGHWLNHGKEHCLVGVKGNPTDINRGLDCDIIVAEVRATSHKPDEIYGIIERLSPGTRKIELFGRAHNVQPNWITLGNQLNGVRLVEPDLIEAFKKLNIPFQTGDHPN